VSAERDVVLPGGRALHVYEAGADDPDAGVVFWHHGTPNTGAPPAPLIPAARARGLRWVSYDRPGYGGSSPHPGRDVAAAAADVAAIADALGVARFAVMGHSGGATHALACAALLGDRVTAAACGSGLAPRAAEGLDWHAGMGAAAVAEHHAAEAGRAALAAHLAAADFDPELFTPADHAALAGPWGWLATVAQQALAGGPDGQIDDGLAYVAPWGFDPAAVRVPVLILHGAEDRMVPAAHGAWLAARVPGAEWWRREGEGHVSVLGDGTAAAALDWLYSR
jgi:pimeloyl-ACP methyl ester carboxylesterase